MDLETSRNFSVMMNPVKCPWVDSRIYFAATVESLLPVLFFFHIGRTGDGLGDLEKFSIDNESAELSLDRSRGLVLFLSLFDLCGGVGNTRL